MYSLYALTSLFSHQLAWELVIFHSNTEKLFNCGAHVPYILPIALTKEWAHPLVSAKGAQLQNSLFNCKKVYLVLALGKKTAVKAVVGSIVSAFRASKRMVLNIPFRFSLRRIWRHS